MFRKGVEMTWQPIETAPKDGSVFLGYWLGKMRDCSALQREDGVIWTFGAFSFHEEMRKGNIPTHWMPLPPPPEVQP